MHSKIAFWKELRKELRKEQTPQQTVFYQQIMFAGYVQTFDSYDNIYDFIENCGNNLYAAFNHAE